MKKILKSFLLLSVFGLGLLINQSFGVVVEGITLPITSDDFSRSSNYKYEFINNYFNFSQADAGWLGYSLYYDGITQFNITDQKSSEYGCPSYSTNTFNSSVLSYSPYSGDCGSYWGNVSHTTNYYIRNYSGGTTYPIYFYMGNGSNFGRNFISVGSNPELFYPKYGFGSGFFSFLDYNSINSQTLGTSPLRVFFNQNINLSSPLDGYDLFSNSGSNIAGSLFRQYYTFHGFRYQTSYQSSPKSFSDLGGSFTKGLVVGGYGPGYSFIINKSNGTGVSWSDFNFVSIGSKCIKSLMDLGTNDPYSGTSSGCQQAGLMVLKGLTYTSSNNVSNVVIIGKDITNPQRLLYQQFDCAEDDIQNIMNGNICPSISHGYLKYNNSDLILPFVDSNNSLNYNNFDILKFFLSGGYNGYISSNDDNGFTLSNDIYSYSFTYTSDPNSKSLKEYYLDSSLGLDSSTVSDTINQKVISACLNNDTFALLNSAFCKIINATYGNIVAIGTGQYMQTTFNESGQLVFQIIDQAGLFDGDYGLIWIQDLNGNWVANCSGGWCDTNPYDNVAGSIYLTGYSDFYASGLSLSYYDSNTGLFFKCPYPVEKVFNFFGWDGSLFGFDFALPINCMYSAFNYGKSFSFLNLNDLYQFGPLINGTTQMHKVLFRFLDMVVMIGLLLLISSIFKFIK